MELKGEQVEIYKTKYSYNNTLAVYLLTSKKEPYTTITVNIEDSDSCKKDCQFVDTNNCRWAERFLKDNNLAEPTGRIGQSGFCTYPEYKFDLSKLKVEK